MQFIRSLPVSARAYIADEFHTRILAPSRCLLCKSDASFEALGYYTRFLTLENRIVPIKIRRFRCNECGRTASILPSFAQPYRLIENAVIDQYFETQTIPPTSPWRIILRNYRKAFTRWLPGLRRVLSSKPERAPPFEAGHEAWRALRKALGDLERITEFLVGEFQITVFGRYRCHAFPV